MFKRLYINDLINWKNSPNRKPLVLRGARQVGKTTLIKQFSIEFNQFIQLNLEKEQHKNIFDNADDIKQLLQAIFFISGKKFDTKNTLIFIDEIQNSKEAISILRYFYEEYPELYVIAAGSLLETLLSEKVSFPVGRVEYLPIRPCNFVEFLMAMGEEHTVNILTELPPPDFAHEKLTELFNRYTLIGGMPEVIADYAKNQDLIIVNKILSGLLASYIDDVGKYAENQSMVKYIRHIIKTGFSFAGQRIKFEGFGESNYRSREIGDAFRILEKTFLLELVYPTTKYNVPLISDFKKSPRLQWLDIGLTNYLAGVQNEVFFSKNIDEIWKGTVAELVVGQELLSAEKDIMFKRNFWVREAKNSNAEVDYIIVENGLLIPIEVKLTSGSQLKSLHLFLDKAPHNIAVRIWSKKFEINELKTQNNKTIKLINIPFYLTFYVREIIRKYI
jgi:predicted AAA+ superfamily ATPase